jgi:import inner membrane translocase subunit TIM16
LIANLIVAGGQVAMKAVANAYSKALANAQRSGVAQEAAAKGAAAGGMFRKKVMQVEEARQVLGVEKGATLERVLERHDKLMTANEKDPETGQYRGSFYLQSMINNAKESVLREDFPDYKPPDSEASGPAKEISDGEEGGGDGDGGGGGGGASGGGSNPNSGRGFAASGVDDASK